MFANWALAHPERFRLLIQHWPHGEREALREAKLRWDALYTDPTKADQATDALPTGDAQRFSYLIRSTTVGSIQHYLAAAGENVPPPPDMIGDLFRHLAARATA